MLDPLLYIKEKRNESNVNVDMINHGYNVFYDLWKNLKAVYKKQ